MAEVSERAGGAGPRPRAPAPTPRRLGCVVALGAETSRSGAPMPGPERFARRGPRSAGFRRQPPPAPPTPGCHIAGCSAHVRARRRGRGARSGQGRGRSGMGARLRFPVSPRRAPPDPARPPARPRPWPTLRGALLVARSQRCARSTGTSRGTQRRSPLSSPHSAGLRGIALVPGRGAMLDPGTALRWGFLRAGGVRPSCPCGWESLLGAASLS